MSRESSDILIDAHIDEGGLPGFFEAHTPADARVGDGPGTGGVSMWAIFGMLGVDTRHPLRLNTYQDRDEIYGEMRRSYELTRDQARAALAYYGRHKRAIDADLDVRHAGWNFKRGTRPSQSEVNWDRTDTVT